MEYDSAYKWRITASPEIRVRWSGILEEEWRKFAKYKSSNKTLIIKKSNPTHTHLTVSLFSFSDGRNTLIIISTKICFLFEVMIVEEKIQRADVESERERGRSSGNANLYIA